MLAPGPVPLHVMLLLILHKQVGRLTCLYKLEPSLLSFIFLLLSLQHCHYLWMQFQMSLNRFHLGHEELSSSSNIISHLNVIPIRKQGGSLF